MLFFTCYCDQLIWFIPDSSAQMVYLTKHIIWSVTPLYTLLGCNPISFTAWKHISRKKQIWIQKKVFTVVRWGLVNPVKCMAVNSILYSLPSTHFNGLNLDSKSAVTTYSVADFLFEGCVRAQMFVWFFALKPNVLSSQGCVILGLNQPFDDL